MWRDDGICVGRWTGVPCTCVASISDKAGCAVSPAAVADLELWACFRCIRPGIPGAMVGPALQNSEFRLQTWFYAGARSATSFSLVYLPVFNTNIVGGLCSSSHIQQTEANISASAVYGEIQPFISSPQS